MTDPARRNTRSTARDVGQNAADKNAAGKNAADKNADNTAAGDAARVCDPAPHTGHGLGPQDDRVWTIGALAAELGLTTRAIRFYEAKGLIAPERRGVARFYTRRDRARMLLILRGKNLGFTLEDIREYLELYDADPAHLAQLKLLAAKVEAHVEDLERKRADIDRTLGELNQIRAQVEAQLAAKTGDT